MTQEYVENILKTVLFPGFSKSIVDFGFVKNIQTSEGKVHIVIEITASSQEISSTLREEITQKLTQAGAEGINLVINQPMTPKESSSRGKNIAPQIKNFVMVSSGKGGVGKSTSTANLAIALAMMGKKVGLLDADIYGPNIPRMMGINGFQAQVVDNKVLPAESYGVKVMSMGMLIEEGQGLLWRGAMIMKAIEQLLRDVAWGDLDVLFIDMPPGTGDAQITLAQSVPVTTGIVVTTPQKVALDDTKRSLDMFTKLHIPLAGIVENMSGFICPESGKEYDIFGKGTTTQLANDYNCPVLANVPLEIAVREGGDGGMPIVFGQPQSKSAEAYRKAANDLWITIEKINEDGGVTNAAIQPTIGLDGKTSACSQAH